MSIFASSPDFILLNTKVGRNARLVSRKCTRKYNRVLNNTQTLSTHNSCVTWENSNDTNLLAFIFHIRARYPSIWDRILSKVTALQPRELDFLNLISLCSLNKIRRVATLLIKKRSWLMTIIAPGKCTKARSMT